MRVKCARCGVEVDEEDMYEMSGERVCEDCYFDSMMPQHPCDPFAQRAAERFEEFFGEVKPENLLEEQRKVYELIKERGKATPDEIIKELGIRPGELTQIFIVLRRLKLAKAHKIGDKIYYVPWDYRGES
ncbi:MAG: hypothetical protein OD815_001305 [Candidatus Alkanophagales archaeon MCA70_species_2]|nr:hypothetical protein [Candidatus Alkanophaga liquidiphilum]